MAGIKTKLWGVVSITQLSASLGNSVFPGYTNRFEAMHRFTDNKPSDEKADNARIVSRRAFPFRSRYWPTAIKSADQRTPQKPNMTVEDLISELKPAITMAKSKVLELRGLL